MEFTKTFSSNIKGVWWSPEAMFIWFHNQSIYRYAAVPLEKYRAFVESASVGKHFHSDIKDHYVTTGPLADSELPEAIRIATLVDV